jgi:FTR1 family protein
MPLLPTFVIGLREGVEASLIVGIVAAFLRQQDRRDALRWMWAGVALAVTLCTGAAVALQLVDESLPQRQQEGLETIVALIAVLMVSGMIVWMRRHARGLASELRASAASALAQGSAWGLVAMAFLAVVREGLETAVFLLAAFQASGDATAAGIGALLGIAVAVAIGWGIYRGGVRLDLTRFFRLTAAVLVLVAAGLVSSALHTAHEAGWLNSLQTQAIDLSWLVHPGSVASSLLTGILGLQPHPTVGEAAGWLLYAVPMLAYVLWPDRWRRAHRQARPVVAVAAALALAGALTACGSGGDSGPAGARKLAITLTDDGCSPAKASVPSGPVTFSIKNGGSSSVTEMELKDADGVILGERENLAEGLSGSFTLTLQPGRYVISCPNGSTEDQGTLTVTGKPAATTTNASAEPQDAELREAVDGYRAYVVRESGRLLVATRQFAAALHAGDLARAQRLYGPTRLHYEAIEPVAESFGALDPEIDARANDVEDPDDWEGFHRIEQILWQRHTTAGTGHFADELLEDVETLRHKVRDLHYQPAQLANGSVELLDEVADSKITGEEDRYSHTDLSDFQGNLTGARVAFGLLRPALVERGEGKLAATIAARFAAVQKGLDAYKRPTALGFATYDQLTKADRHELAEQIEALTTSLQAVAPKVST